MNSNNKVDLVNQHNNISPAVAWFIWCFGAIFYFYEFCLQSSPSIMVPELMKSFNVTAGQLGRLSAYYFYAYALMQVPVGILLDRYGPRTSMALSCLVCAIGAYVFSHAQLLWQAEAARVLMGLASAFAMVSAMKLATLWFPSQRFSLLTGLIVMFGMMGAIGGQVPLSLLVGHLGWRYSMEILSYAGFILSIAFAIFVKNGPLFTAQKEMTQQRISLAAVKNMLSHKQIWIMAAYGGLMFAPTVAFGELWGVPYIVSIFDIARTEAARIVSLIFVGWAIGSPFFGYVACRFNRRLPYMWLGTLMSLWLMALILFVLHHDALLLSVALFLFGFFSSAFVLVFSLAKESVPHQFAATALGFINMLNMLLPAMLQVVIGMLLDYFWNGQMQHDIRLYNQHAYHYASFALLFVIVLAAFFLRSIKKTSIN